jgi:hypothetical protein
MVMVNGLRAYLGVGASTKQAVLGNESPQPEDAATPWASPLRAVGEALARGDLKTAALALEAADASALASGRWEAMIEVGDAFLRVAEISRARRMLAHRASRNYLAALYCARQQRNINGVLRAARGFGGLGDRDSVDQCLLIAEGMAQTAGDDAARERVRRLVTRLSARPAAGV